MNNYYMRLYSFEPYGLNKYRNFLETTECPCGCGNKASFIFDDFDELYEFAAGAIIEQDCNCGIFVDSFFNMIAFIKNPNMGSDEPVIVIIQDEKNLDFFAHIDAEFGLDIYGLMVEDTQGNYKIIED